VTLLEGILPIDRPRLPMEIVAGVTLAALAIPVTMGYTKIAGMPVITGLYTILFPLAVFAIFGVWRSSGWCPARYVRRQRQSDEDTDGRRRGRQEPGRRAELRRDRADRPAIPHHAAQGQTIAERSMRSCGRLRNG